MKGNFVVKTNYSITKLHSKNSDKHLKVPKIKESYRSLIKNNKLERLMSCQTSTAHLTKANGCKIILNLMPSDVQSINQKHYLYLESSNKYQI